MINTRFLRCTHTAPATFGTTIFFALLAIVSILLISGCQTEQRASVATEGVPSDQQIRKSPNDSREYRYLELPNKMRVALVSDPETDKSAAAMAVYRGSFHEPEHRPGLAHFLEHMLFIQTEAYPEPGAFQKFVAANGGSTNAYTAFDHTNYFFNVAPQAFPEALDRWAHFFIKPIISAEYSEREKNAVHSEYQMQIKDDGWRNYMVGKQALNPQHPATRFTIGSLDTLAGDIQADLIDFFETQYSADQMGLVLISNQSLDELEALVKPLFSQVANKDIGPAYVDTPVYTDEQLPQWVANQTFKDGATLTFAYPLPSTLPHYKTKPEQYFANLIGHEGTGSLYQYLVGKGWIESLGSGVSVFDRGTSVLNVSIELTPAGDQHKQDIAHALFSYIELIKSSPPKAWLYQEQAKVAELGFRFQEKSSPTGLVYRLAPQLDHYPPADLLVAPYLMEQFDARLIGDYLRYLTPDNVVVEYTSPDVTGDEIEPWFKVPYEIKPFQLNKTLTTQLPFHLPEPNPFLPENLSLVDEDQAPIARVEQRKMEFWLDTDTRFGGPRSTLIVALAVPGGLQSPSDRAHAQLYRTLVQDSLSELVYPAYLAGLSYQIGVSDAGFEVTVAGYDDKQTELLTAVIRALLQPTLDAQRFASLKESLIKDWQNMTRERPYSQTFSALTDTLRSGRWPRPMLIDAIAQTDLNRLDTWRQRNLERVSVVGLLHGNVTRENLNTVTLQLASLLPLAEQRIEAQRASVRDVTSALLLEIPVDHNDSSLILHIQDDDDSFAARARSLLAAQMLQPEYFRQLRTEQQLGYVVSATGRAIADRGGITFIVQSPMASARAVEQATVEFMQAFNAQPLDDASFAQQQAGLITQLLEKPKNLAEQSQRYWSDLSRDVTTFDSREQIAQAVQALTPALMSAYLAEVEARLKSRRLLIFSRGQFDEVPTHGYLLSDPTAAFP